jgi:organic radical activating enzyme
MLARLLPLQLRHHEHQSEIASGDILVSRREDTTPGRPLRAYTFEGGWRDFSTDEFVAKDLIRFRGWKCAAGARNLAIKPDGRIRAASCGEGGTLGNVYEDFTLPLEWRVCSRERCTCGADLFIPKYRTDQNSHLLRRTYGQTTEFEREDNTADYFEAVERVHVPTAKQIYWEITHRCNYDCSYCQPAVHNKKDQLRPFHQMAQALERLCEQFARGEKVNFILSGGEPTLVPFFLDWVRMIKTLGHHVSTHSNGSKPALFYQKLILYADLNLSLHMEFWRPEKFFEIAQAVTAKKAEFVDQRQVGHFEIKIMMPPGKRQECLEILERLHAIPDFTRLCMVSVGAELEQVNPAYSSEEHELFGPAGT